MNLRGLLCRGFDRFRLGQVFFISGVTWGLFFGDGLRKALFIAALLCLTKAQIKEKFYEEWTEGQKRAGKFLLLFCAWAFFIPLFFGFEPFLGRLEGIARPVELFIIMWEALIFAKDEFFFRTLKKFAIATCAVYSVLALGQRIYLDFSENFRNWIITGLAWRVGTLLSGLVPWVIYAFLTEPSRRRTIGYAVCVVLTWATMFLTLFSTFWLVVALQAAAMFALTGILYRRYFKRACLLILAFAILGACAISCMAAHYGNTKGIDRQWEQIVALYKEHDFNKFTNKRDKIWMNSFVLIAKRPVFGYGWTDGELVGKNIGHMHNAILQAAWNIGWPGAAMYAGLLLILVSALIKELRKSRNMRLPAVPFVVLLAFLAYAVCGALDDMFRSQRTIMTLYLSAFMLMLSPIAGYMPGKEKKD